MAGKKHPGFGKVARSIERKEGVSLAEADAMLASASRVRAGVGPNTLASTRKDSKKARSKNPDLKKVKVK